MKKINELVTKTEKPEHKSKRRAVTFGSFKRAEEKQIQERKDREHQEELARIAEDAKIQKAIADEEARVIKEENTRKRNELITKKLSNAFGTKTDVDFKPVREQVIDKYLPQLREQENLDDYPKPFEAEPALNAELSEFKKKINEHLHKVGFMGSGGGGIGAIRDAVDVDGSAQTDGKFLKFRASDSKFIGDDVAISDGSLALTKLDIDGGTDIGEAIVDADLLIVDNGAGGTNRKTAASRIKTYVADVTLTTAAQSNITSVGTLTSLTVDNIIINGTNIGHTSDTDAISIASDGKVTLTQNLIMADNSYIGTATTGTLIQLLDDNVVMSSGEHSEDDQILTLESTSTNTSFNKPDLGLYAKTGTANAADGAFIGNITFFADDDAGGTDFNKRRFAAIFAQTLDVSNGSFDGKLIFEVASNSSPSYTAAIDGTGFIVGDGKYIGSSSAPTAMLIDTNGIVTFVDDIKIKNGGTIGTVGDPDSITIDSSGNVTASQNLIVTGDFTVNGDTTTVNTATLSVEDPLIILANGNNGADSVDIGFYGLYDTSGSQDLYAGLFRDANDSGKFKLFKDLQAAPTTTVNTGGTGYAVGTLVANIEGDVTGTLQTAAQANVTSLGTLTTLTVDNIIINGTNIGHTSDTDAIAIGSGGVVNFTQAPTVASAAIKTAGKETIYIPASAMYPTTTNGCAALAQVETTAQQPEFKVLDFDKDSDEHAQFTVAFPKSWNASTITFRVFWIGIASTDGCAWALQGRSVADNAESVGAFGTAVVVQDDSQGDATETLVSAESGNVTIAGAADDTLTYFQIFRDVSDGNDDMAGDARLLGVQLFFTTDAANDA